MRVEIWSPDGQEAAAVGPLYEVVEAENEVAVGLFDRPKQMRVWLDRGDEQFLRKMLARLDDRRAANSHERGDAA